MNTAFRFAKHCAYRLYYNCVVRGLLKDLVILATVWGFAAGCVVIISKYPVAFFSVGAAVIISTIGVIAWLDFKATDEGGA